MTELAGLLSIMGNDSGQTYIILDALDEIQGPDKGLMNFLSELFRAQKSTGANILATSRFIPDVEKRFKLEEQCAISEIRAMDEDVKNFIQGNLSTLPSFVMERQDMAHRIENEISQAASGM